MAPRPQSPFEIIVVGGSLSGLVHALMLKRLGHNVTILERTPHALEHQAAGIGSGPAVQQFLDEFDDIKDPLSLPCDGLRAVDAHDKQLWLRPIPMKMNSWDSLYFRLRSNFDGFKSGHYLQPPPPRNSDGKGDYLLGCHVTGIEVSDGLVTVHYQNVKTGSDERRTVNLVIGADGAGSSVRRLMLDDPPPRKYAGYVLWRGLVKETEISDDNRSSLDKHFTFLCYKGQYVIVYPIPGENGSLSRGERYLNLAWYSSYSVDGLREIMTDKNGKHHEWTMPIGLVDDLRWTEAKARAEPEFSPMFMEVLNKIKNPFIQVISDRSSPQASFHDGKVLLVGDALNLMRPHSGSGFSQATTHSLWLKEHMTGKFDVEEWDRRCLEDAYTGSLRAVLYGNYFMHGKFWAIGSAVRYFLALGMANLRNWWYRR